MRAVYYGGKVMSKHPSHKTRMSDASTYDEVCVLCGRTDQVPGGWGDLAFPCPKNKEWPERDELAMKLAKQQEDDPCPLEES